MPILLSPALLFFCNALLFISMFSLLPQLREGLGIDKATLGTALLGFALGTLLALPVAGKLTNRLSPRLAATISLSIYAALTPAVAVLPLWGVVAIFIAIGFVRTILDVAENMVATGIESRSGVKVLSRSHGFWSVGLLVGAVVSGWMAGAGITPAAHLSLIALAVLCLCVVVWRVTPADAALSQSESGARAPVFVIPDRPIVLIAVMVIGIGICEGAIYDWGIFFIRERIVADEAVAGMLYACFTIGMGITRLVGDRLREVFAPVALVRASAVSVATGLVVLLLATESIVAALGLTLIGAGVALNMPIAVATTIQLTGNRSPAENLAALSLTMLLSTLGVPPLLGFVADHWGIAASFVAVLPLTALTFMMAPVAAGRPVLSWRRRP